MEFYITTITDIGIKRMENQDALFASAYSNGRENATFSVLSDGMGGLSYGAVASNSIVSAFFQWAEKRLPCEDYALVTAGQIHQAYRQLLSM